MSNILEEYLVSLGFQVNNAAFNQFNNTLRQAEGVVRLASTNMSRAMSTAAGVMVTSITGVTMATAGLLHELGKTDLAYQKFALRMWLTNQSAKELKTTLDALGESIEDAAFIPELRKQFQELYVQGRQMEPPEDYAEYMRQVQSISFEFKRMKLEATYALQWIGYHLMKYLAEPIRSVKEALKTFNDYVTRNMPQWTEKVASALASIVNMGRALVWLFTRELPGGLQIFQAALAALGLYLLTSPIGLFLTTLGAALILLEDFYGYTQGWDSSKTLAPMWKWLLEFNKDIGESPALRSLKKDFRELKGAITDLVKAFGELYDSLSQIEGLKSLNWGDFMKQWWKNMVDQTSRYIQAITFVLEFWKALIEGNIGDFISRKLVDLQNFANGKKPGDEGYHPGGTPPRRQPGPYGGGHPTSPENWNDAYGGGGVTGRKPNPNNKWQMLAAKVSAQTGIPAELIYAQWAHESANFSSELYRETHNAGGLTQVSPVNPSDPQYLKQPDGSFYYRKFSSDEAFADAYAKYITHPDYVEAGVTRARTPEQFARALKEGGPYYGDDETRYANALRRHMAGYGVSDPSLNGEKPMEVSSAPTVITTTNNIEVTVPPGTDADGYALAIAKALEPYQGRATQITVARQIRDLQGVGA